MRIAYIDEAGTSASEPVTLVVGAVINADTQVIEIESYLSALRKKYINDTNDDAFVFHAKDIFHGSGYFSDREKWAFEMRMNILKDILKIFVIYQVPLCVGYFIDPNPSEKRSIIIRHAMAYMECFVAIETYMRGYTTNEIAMLIAEDHPTMKKYLKDVHRDFTTQNDNPIKNVHKEIMPIKHVHGTLSFADKNESALLQIADAFAFVIRRFLMGGSKVDDLMACFLPPYKEAFKDVYVEGCGYKLILLAPGNSHN